MPTGALCSVIVTPLYVLYEEISTFTEALMKSAARKERTKCVRV